MQCQLWLDRLPTLVFTVAHARALLRHSFLAPLILYSAISFLFSLFQLVHWHVHLCAISLSPGEPHPNCSARDEEPHPNVTILRTFIGFMTAYYRWNSVASDVKTLSNIFLVGKAATFSLETMEFWWGRYDKVEANVFIVPRIRGVPTLETLTRVDSDTSRQL